jgi:RNA polymerase-associated protein LEO1
MSSAGSISDNEEFDAAKAPPAENDDAGNAGDAVLDDNDLEDEDGDDLFGDGGDDNEEEPS